MNSPDPFEARLGRIPFRPAPPSLREDVLKVARDALVGDAQRPVSRWNWSIAEWLWPHPAAWGTLGLAWLAVVLLNIIALESPITPAPRLQTVASPAWTAALRDQRAMLRSLLQDPPAPGLPVEPGPGAFWQRENRRPWALA